MEVKNMPFPFAFGQRLRESFLSFAESVGRLQLKLQSASRSFSRFDSSSTFKEHYKVRKNCSFRAMDLVMRLTNRSTTRAGLPIKILSVDWTQEGDIVITYSIVATKTPNMRGVAFSYFFSKPVPNLKYIIKRLRYHR